jgi:hypothetical protein
MLGGRRCCGNLVSIGDAADAPADQCFSVEDSS